LQVGLQRQRKKKKKLCMANTTTFWIEIDHISIWSLQFQNFAYKPLMFSISNFKPLKIRLKGKWVKIQVITDIMVVVERIKQRIMSVIISMHTK
jgi:hypothetical protein